MTNKINSENEEKLKTFWCNHLCNYDCTITTNIYPKLCVLFGFINEHWEEEGTNCSDCPTKTMEECQEVRDSGTCRLLLSDGWRGDI